jgi:hypothetical protein
MRCLTLWVVAISAALLVVEPAVGRPDDKGIETQALSPRGLHEGPALTPEREKVEEIRLDPMERLKTMGSVEQIRDVYGFSTMSAEIVLNVLKYLKDNLTPPTLKDALYRVLGIGSHSVLQKLMAGPPVAKLAKPRPEGRATAAPGRRKKEPRSTTADKPSKLSKKTLRKDSQVLARQTEFIDATPFLDIFWERREPPATGRDFIVELVFWAQTTKQWLIAYGCFTDAWGLFDRVLEINGKPVRAGDPVPRKGRVILRRLSA